MDLLDVRENPFRKWPFQISAELVHLFKVEGGKMITNTIRCTFLRCCFTSVRQRRRPLYGYSPPAAYLHQRRRLQYGYGPAATYVHMQLWYISHTVSE